MKYKSGLIGCGRIGHTFELDPKRTGIWTHAGAYNDSESIDFAGVYDANLQAAEKCANHYKTNVVSIKQMTHFDIVSFAVPERIHESALLDFHCQCIETGSAPKILWVEKPFTGCLKKAEHITKLFAQLDCHIHVNYQRRYCDGFNKLKEFGRPEHISITYTRGLLNTASHFIDLIAGLYGEPNGVYPTGTAETTLFGMLDVLSKTNFIMSYDSFDVAFTMLNNVDYNQNHILLYYPDKIVRVPPLQTNFQIMLTVDSTQYSEYKDLATPQTCKLDYSPMKTQTRIFTESIIKNDYSKLNNGLQSLAVMRKVLRV